MENKKIKEELVCCDEETVTCEPCNIDEWKENASE